MAYCCRDFVVTAWLSVMTAEPTDDTVTYYFFKVQIEAGLWLVARTKMGSFMVSVI